jgi:release factor glutamine methyltransferase
MVAAQPLPTERTHHTSDPIADVAAVFKALRVPAGVYAPQEDSRLLLTALAERDLVAQRRVLDLCSGSGVLAIGAAVLGAGEVTAFDISAPAVACATDNAIALGVEVDARQGSLPEALAQGPYDVVVSNPPYVPDSNALPPKIGLSRTWHGGRDGRSLLDPLCVVAPDLLSDGGTMLLVHSEFADAERSLTMLRAGGLHARVVERQRIPFGPVLTANARWLEAVGMLERGRRFEELCVIRADKPAGPGA